MAAEIASARAHKAEGVGLYRTEYLFLGRDTAPTEEEHYRVAKQVLAECAPFPVLIRTFDLGADKESKIFPATHPEANPVLGMRATRLALKHRGAFSTQLRGLLRAAVHGPLRIMLPLISGLEEFHDALAVIEEAKEELEEEGIAHAADVPIGVMIELPSAALVADVLADHVDFMSIGTNDLIQYTLAIDRENDEVNYLYQPLHPAILRLIKMVCDAGRRGDVPVSICGEMAADPLFTWVLVGMGGGALHAVRVDPADQAAAAALVHERDGGAGRLGAPGTHRRGGGAARPRPDVRALPRAYAAPRWRRRGPPRRPG